MEQRGSWGFSAVTLRLYPHRFIVPHFFLLRWNIFSSLGKLQCWLMMLSDLSCPLFPRILVRLDIQLKTLLRRPLGRFNIAVLCMWQIIFCKQILWCTVVSQLSHLICSTTVTSRVILFIMHPGQPISSLFLGLYSSSCFWLNFCCLKAGLECYRTLYWYFTSESTHCSGHSYCPAGFYCCKIEKV